MKKQQPNFVVYCDYCGKRQIVKQDSHHMTEIKVAAVPGLKGKTLPRPTMVKCPTCGRGVAFKKLQGTNEKPNDDKLNGRETGTFGPTI